MTIQQMLLTRKQILLQADAGLSSGRLCSETNDPFAAATLIWYQVGDASGRGGEVWCLTSTSGDAKLGDWLDPNDDPGDYFIFFSNPVGDGISFGATFSVWHKIGGASSDNRFQTQSGNGVIELTTFDVDLGRDGSTSDDGPANWQVDIDST